jgi:hypothetical protein
MACGVQPIWPNPTSTSFLAPTLCKACCIKNNNIFLLQIIKSSLTKNKSNKFYFLRIFLIFIYLSIFSRIFTLYINLFSYLYYSLRLNI